MLEQDILKLPKNRNYYYKFKTMDSIETCVLYYRLTDYMWVKHCNYCEEKGLSSKIKQWVQILIDKKDFELIKEWGVKIKFSHLDLSKTNISQYFAIQLYKRGTEKQSYCYIQRLILNFPKHMQIDHISRDTFDNRRNNLRIVTSAENGQNINGARSDSKTSIRGVIIHFNKTNNFKYYRAQVYKNNKAIFQQYFPLTPQGLLDAEQAVIKARRELFTYSEMDN